VAGNWTVVGASGTSVDVLTLSMVAADGFICVSGLIGNALVIYVISRSSFKSKTVTTNTFILNLTAAESVSERRTVLIVFKTICTINPQQFEPMETE